MGDIKAPLEGSGFIDAKNHLGHLVMFTEVVKSEKRFDELRKAEGDLLTVNWTCFMCHGGPNATIQERALISNPYVVDKVHRDGSLTLGYIVQLEGKGGNHGAIVLQPPSDIDVQRATSWWETHKPSPVQAPVGTQQSVSDDPWAGMNAAPAATPVAPTGAQQAWGSASAATPASPPAPPPPLPTATHLDEATLRTMPIQAVQALMSQGMVTREAAVAAGHNV